MVDDDRIRTSCWSNRKSLLTTSEYGRQYKDVRTNLSTEVEFIHRGYKEKR
jgi:hypothetical protein